MKKNVVVGQSGGPSPVINATLYGVLTQAFSKDDIGKIYGMRYGIEGLIKDNLIDLDYFRPGKTGAEERLGLLKHTPSSYLGCCRHKLKAAEKDPAEYEKIFDQFEKYNIGYVFYIGGNDSMDTTHKLSEYAKKHGIDTVVVGVPKTVDNDLMMTDHVPGYGSAAKYIATSIREIIYDLHVYDRSTLVVAEMMGRHAGWLTAAAALAVPPDNHDELMIYLPEKTFDMDKFCFEVGERLHRVKRLVVAVSEGLRVKDGRFVSELEAVAERDAFGHAALGGCARMLTHALKAKVKAKYRPVELSVMQRSAGHCLSQTDINESVMAGQQAVEYAMRGETGKMVSFHRKEGDGYAIDTRPVDVCDVCNQERLFPDDWVSADHFVTEDFYRYAQPLIQGTPDLAMRDGLPHYIYL